MFPQLLPRPLRHLALRCLCVAACSRVTQADDDGYARPQLLIEAATLAATPLDPSLVILDRARSRVEQVGFAWERGKVRQQ